MDFSHHLLFLILIIRIPCLWCSPHKNHFIIGYPFNTLKLMEFWLIPGTIDPRMRIKISFYQAIEYSSSVLVLIFLLLYSYANFFVVPYFGFDYSTEVGEVINVWANQPASQSILPGDQLLQIGSVTWTEFISNTRQSLFGENRTGDNVEIRVQRGDQEINVQWTLPGPNLIEIVDRLNALGLWVLFWLAGTATILLVRPRSVNRGLLIAFYYVFAPWLLFGWMSHSGIWYTRLFAHALAWIVALLYIHLNWVFPRSLGRIPPVLLGTAYLGAGILASLELLQLLPSQAYIIGVMFSLAVGIILFILHAILQPDVRRDLKVLMVAIFLAACSGFLLSFQAFVIVSVNLWLVWIAFLSLTTIPGAYFYVMYRRQLGGLELRTNRIISLYLFSILLLIISTFIVWFVDTSLTDFGLEVALEITALFLAGFVGATLYPGFQRLIEQRVLGIPLPPAQLIEAYTARIITSLDSESLVNLLTNEILPSLLVRQSALLGISEDNSLITLYRKEVDEGNMPSQAIIPDLVAHSNRYLSDTDNALPNSLNWVRLVLPLAMGGRIIGIWLLGRRDPDNFYDQSEITFLRTIANQTAIALTNIAHTKLLHALYQADIERNEKERAALARGLHDEVLNQLAVISMRHPSLNGVDAFQEGEELIANYLREVISDLRPPMLNYGLCPAIDELVDNLSQRISKYPIFEIDVEADSTRFDPNIEQHVFRIVQQACENAVQHAHARCIRISGALGSESIHLIVADDGFWFLSAGSNDLEQLLQQGHYGLVGMYERASIIGADLKVRSQPGQGTLVEVVWPKRQDGENF